MPSYISGSDGWTDTDAVPDQEKRITLEYCLLKGVNTDSRSAKNLARFMPGLSAVVNLIPWNPVEGLEYESPSAEEIRKFTNDLDRLHVNYTLRMPKGRNISGACGQLATNTRRELIIPRS